MAVEVVAVAQAEKPELWSFLQDYIAEMTAFVDVPRIDGVYPYEFFDLYWKDPNRFPFWALVDGERGGFALVRFADEHRAMQMAEFYITPAHRRSGIGLDFAHQILRRYPGYWKIRQIATNAPAIAFWHRVVSPYGYSEERFVDREIPRVEQTLTVA
jgi:predicted acetyltransferase